ncbi:methyltransferase [Paenibacillus sinopodophylli]|uniref:methyltransferase n=1 Tax=Paenibacillus sinopodophylli TaxID=1837342 RepID=UPI00110CD2D0|nr:methyltransferase [Paenibacillus sinopodophylli]
MDKFLIEVYIPALNRSYDVYIPTLTKLHEVEALLAAAITELSDGYFTAGQDTMLCDQESGILLDINQSAIELGLQNGSRLMLI